MLQEYGDEDNAANYTEAEDLVQELTRTPPGAMPRYVVLSVAHEGCTLHIHFASVSAPLTPLKTAVIFDNNLDRNWKGRYRLRRNLSAGIAGDVQMEKLVAFAYIAGDEKTNFIVADTKGMEELPGGFRRVRKSCLFDHVLPLTAKVWCMVYAAVLWWR